jgi:beta-1,4-mannosyl-glycoprotein beta-1,4-N-acetylglucosaminyltransferase
VLVDTFLFNGEFDLLNVRLQELKDRVDLFVLVESDRTFAGKPKPLEFAKRGGAYSEWNIRCVEMNGYDISNPWANEANQRNSIVNAITDIPPDALVLLSDVDEIPRAESIPQDMPPETLAMFQQDFYYYDYHTRARGNWFGTRLCRADYLRQLTPQGARVRGNMVIRDGGWHFSYQGGAESIRAKLQAFSHQEYNQPPYTDLDYIERCIDEGLDLFGRPEMQFERLHGDAHLPRCLQGVTQWAHG